MSKQTKAFDALIKAINLGIYVSAPASVVSYDADSHRADVQPLFISTHADGSSGQWPMIQDAPVLKHVGDLAVGDSVLLLFGDRAIDNLNGNRPFKPGTGRMHWISDAFVIGVIQ